MKQADVVIVLGAAVWPGGRPSRVLEGRVAHAVQLLKAGAAPRMIVTGGLGRHPPAEAEVMGDLAVAAGVEPERILLEDQAGSTFDSARLCTEIMRGEGWRTAIVVTDRFHLPRSLMAFRAFGIDAAGSASNGGALAALGWRHWAATQLREAVAFAWYAIRLKVAPRG